MWLAAFSAEPPLTPPAIENWVLIYIVIQPGAVYIGGNFTAHGKNSGT